MTKFMILAVADMTKSLQTQKDESFAKNGNQRNMSIDADEQQSENIANWNRSSRNNSNQMGSLKLVLKPIDNEVNTNKELITAFEYDGSLSKLSGPDQNSLVGCILEYNSDLDFSRDILLLKSSHCRLSKINETTTYRRNTDSHSINAPAINNADVQFSGGNAESSFVNAIDLDNFLDDGILDDLFDQDEDDLLFI